MDLVNPNAQPVSTSDPRRILVVDDDKALAEFLRRALIQLGYDVECGHQGCAAVDAYAQALASGRPYDLVIMDLNMPGMDGRQCLVEMAHMSPEVVVLLTTGDPTESCAQGWARQPNGVLQKPFTLNDLIETVRRLLPAAQA